MAIRNLDWMRGVRVEGVPDFGAKLFEALSDIAQQHQTLAQQVNGNPTGGPLPPPAIDGLKVKAQNGHFQISIAHGGEFYRDVHYYVEHADNPQFTDAHTIHLGHSRNHNIFLGNVTRYWRAFAAYPTSAAGSPVYHGGPVAPLAVSGGGAAGGPAFLASQGSGTGNPTDALSGPGPVAFRSITGAPPIRGPK